MKLYSPTVSKFFSFFFYDGESRTQAVEFRFPVFARCWEKIGYREDATDKFARSFIRAKSYPNRVLSSRGDNWRTRDSICRVARRNESQLIFMDARVKL